MKPRSLFDIEEVDTVTENFNLKLVSCAECGKKKYILNHYLIYKCDKCNEFNEVAK